MTLVWIIIGIIILSALFSRAGSARGTTRLHHVPPLDIEYVDADGNRAMHRITAVAAGRGPADEGRRIDRLMTRSLTVGGRQQVFLIRHIATAVNAETGNPIPNLRDWADHHADAANFIGMPRRPAATTSGGKAPMRHGTKVALIVLGLLVGLPVAAIVLGAIFGDIGSSPQSHAAATDSAAQPVADPTPPIPADEQRFIQIVQQARNSYEAGNNDMAKGAARPARAAALCSALSTTEASQWIGTVATLSSNNDGRGVLGVTIAPNITVSTTNNAISDVLGMKTLIDPQSHVFAEAQALSVGQGVVFSGSLAHSETDCFQEMSVTLQGSMEQPEFLFAFSEIAPR